MRRLDAILLAGIGVLAVHQVAYSTTAVFGASSAVGHGHLQLAWLVGGLAAVTGLALSVTRSLRHRGHRPAAAPVLAAWIAAGFTGMEWLERLLDGAPATALVGEPVFWLGLAASPIVALGLRALTRSVERIAHQLATRDEAGPRPARPVAVFGSTSVELVPLILRSDSVSRRGPPGRSRH